MIDYSIRNRFSDDIWDHILNDDAALIAKLLYLDDQERSANCISVINYLLYKEQNHKRAEELLDAIIIIAGLDDVRLAIVIECFAHIILYKRNEVLLKPFLDLCSQKLGISTDLLSKMIDQYAVSEDPTKTYLL